MTAPRTDPFDAFAATVGPRDPRAVAVVEDRRDHGDPDPWDEDRALDRYEAALGWGR